MIRWTNSRTHFTTFFSLIKMTRSAYNFQQNTESELIWTIISSFYLVLIAHSVLLVNRKKKQSDNNRKFSAENCVHSFVTWMHWMIRIFIYNNKMFLVYLQWGEQPTWNRGFVVRETGGFFFQQTIVPTGNIKYYILFSIYVFLAEFMLDNDFLMYGNYDKWPATENKISNYERYSSWTWYMDTHSVPGIV